MLPAKIKKIFLSVCFLLIVNCVNAAEKIAPDFTAKTLAGKPYNLYNNLASEVLTPTDNKLVIISFWGLMCVPCKQKMDFLKKLTKKYPDKLEVLCISIDPAKAHSKIKKFVRRKRYGFTFLVDSESKIFDLYGGEFVPYTVVVNQKKEIIYAGSGHSKAKAKGLEDVVRVHF